MEVADDRCRSTGGAYATHDAGNRRRGRLVVDGDADDLRTGSGQRQHLVGGCVRIRGVRVRHRLHDNREPGSDWNETNPRAGRLTSRSEAHDAVRYRP